MSTTTRHPSPRPTAVRSMAAIFVLGLGLSMTALGAAAHADGPQAGDRPLTAQLDALFQSAYTTDTSRPGAAVLVKRGDTVLLRKGYGMADLEHDLPIAPEMVFRLGSITKQFTAVAAMILVQDGKLDVADPIHKHLPNYPEAGQRITVEHLLTHTSGIPSYTDDPAFWEGVRDDATVAEMVDSFDDKDLQFEPGTAWRYNNSGYFLLGAVIEAVSGQTYEDFIESRIFEPLGMKRSDYGNHGRIISGRVQGYHGDPDAGYVNAPYMSMSHPYAAGSLLSNVDDLARWDAALYGDRLLDADHRARLWKRHQLTDGESVDYGYGWTIHTLDGQSAVSHGGGIFGFSTMMVRVPEEEIFVAVLSNIPGHAPSPDNLAKRVVDLVLDRPTLGATPVEVDVATLRDYEAVYRIDEGTTRAVMVEDGALVTQRSGGGKATPAFIGDDRFVYPDSLTLARFERGAEGRVTHMVVQQWGGSEERAERTDEALPKPAVAVDIDPAIIDRYAGSYEVMPGFIIEVTRQGDAMVAVATGQGPLDLIAQSETVFVNDDVGVRMTFAEGDDNVTLVLEQGGQRLEAERQVP